MDEMESATSEERSERPELARLCREIGAVFASEALERASARWATGLSAVDASLGGGLPSGALAEAVEAVPGAGGTLLQHRLLEAVRSAGAYGGLVDGADGFAPEEAPAATLRHLYWARCRSCDEALRVADVLAADGNLAVLMLDLRGNAPGEARRLAPSRWYRLQRAVRRAGAAALALTPVPLVPAARARLRLSGVFGAEALDQPRRFLAERVEAAPLHASGASKRSE